MLRPPISEKIGAIIYKKMTGKELERSEEKLLKKWLRKSKYYRSLLEDINTDQQLKNKLMQSYLEDRDEFWDVVITYRTALHDGMPPRKGNFWERLFRF
jgi:hypothetical protein